MLYMSSVPAVRDIKACRVDAESLPLCYEAGVPADLLQQRAALRLRRSS